MNLYLASFTVSNLILRSRLFNLRAKPFPDKDFLRAKPFPSKNFRNFWSVYLYAFGNFEYINPQNFRRDKLSDEKVSEGL